MNMSIQSLLMQVDSQKRNTDGLKKPMLCSCMGIDRYILHSLGSAPLSLFIRASQCNLKHLFGPCLRARKKNEISSNYATQEFTSHKIDLMLLYSAQVFPSILNAGESEVTLHR